MAQSMTTAEAGRIGSRKRWRDHVPVRVHLGDLTNDQRKIVMAAIEAERAKVETAKTAAGVPTPTAAVTVSAVAGADATDTEVRVDDAPPHK